MAKGYGAAKQQYDGRDGGLRAPTAEQVFEVGLGAKGGLRTSIMEHTADLEAGGAQARRVRLTMPAKAEYVALSRLTIAALGSRFGLEPEVVADLKVAVTEACSLLVAPPGNSRGYVGLGRRDPDRVRSLGRRVDDQGHG